MSSKRWFLPQVPDVLGMLRTQTTITIDGMEALEAWAQGDGDAAGRLRELERRADTAKRELREALTVAFTTPLDPEDIFELSCDLDEALNGAKNTLREAEVMRAQPDRAIAEMAGKLAAGTHHLGEAFRSLAESETDQATAAADDAVKSQRAFEAVYRNAMSGLIEVDDPHEMVMRRELYRRLARTSDDLIRVAERVWYAVLKES